MKPFFPAESVGVKVAVTAASSATAITGPSDHVRIHNAGPNKAFFKLRSGTGTAAVNVDTVIAAGATEVFAKGKSDYIAAICDATETATLYVQPGFA